MERGGISFETPDKEHITRIAVHDSLVTHLYSWCSIVVPYTHRAAAWGLRLHSGCNLLSTGIRLFQVPERSLQLDHSGTLTTPDCRHGRCKSVPR
jgi:hypothetical protein